MSSLKIVLGSAATIVLVVAAFSWRGDPTAAHSPLVVRAAALTEAESAALRTWPSSRVAPSPVDLREKIWSATNIVSAVRDAQQYGTPDEKLWAADAAHECWALLHPYTGSPPAGLEAPTLTAAQMAAKSEIETRCAGFKNMLRADRQALEKELLEAAASSTSDYAQIHAIAMNPEHPELSDAEIAIVQEAFYGADPLLRRDAAYAIAGAIKDQQKMVNMLEALYDETATPLSTFDTLEQCLTEAERCGQQHALGPPVPEGATREQLEAIDTIARIRDGVASKMHVRDLIALQ